MVVFYLATFIEPVWHIMNIIDSDKSFDVNQATADAFISAINDVRTKNMRPVYYFALPALYDRILRGARCRKELRILRTELIAFFDLNDSKPYIQSALHKI